MNVLISKYRKNLRDLRAELRTKEKVLAGIAMELHDNITQLLAAANLALDMINNPGIQISNKELTAKTQKYILESMNQIRQLSHTIVIDVPEYSFDLKTEIQNLSSIFPPAANCKLIFGLSSTEKIRNKHLSMHVFRIIQELLTNVKKHSEATEVLVLVKCISGSIDILVSDNGYGLRDPDEKSKKGIGLQNIRQRVKLCEGNIQIISDPGNGMNVHIVLPLLRKQQ